MERDFLLSYMKELLKPLSKLLYSFSLLSSFVEIFQLLHEAHANYVTHSCIIKSTVGHVRLWLSTRTTSKNIVCFIEILQQRLSKDLVLLDWTYLTFCVNSSNVISMHVTL